MSNAISVGTTLLKVPHVAERLGIGERKVWRMISQKVLPAVQVGARGTRITEAALEAYIVGLSDPSEGTR